MVATDPSSARFTRQRALRGFGRPAQQRLADAQVVVVGAGGLGCALLPVLAAAGVGELVVIDDDIVEETNLHRQTLFGPADIGVPKAEAAAAALARIAPEVRVTARVARFGPGALDEVLDADVLVDASDNAATRYLANDTAALAAIPLVWGAALGYHGQLGVAWDERGVDYRDLHPQPGADELAGDSCESVGVLPSVCATIGALMAGQVLALLTGIGEPLLGRVLSVDALTGSVREFGYRRDPDAVRPGSLDELTAERIPVIAEVDAVGLAQLLASGTTRGVHETPPLLVDVREGFEVAGGVIPGALHIPLGVLLDRLDELADDVPVVVYCQSGVRSATAVTRLEGAGRTRVRHLRGGYGAWVAAGGATTSPDGQG